jgi:hypothetical protein
MKSFIVCLGLGIVLFSCGRDQQEITNPNGMSEMSLIMENWYKQLDVYSKDLKAGKMTADYAPLDEKKIFTARVSKSKDNVHGPAFDGFTNSFFYNYHEIGKAVTYEEQVKAFNLTVQSCVNCHEQHCQGPIVRIKKLTVSQ